MILTTAMLLASVDPTLTNDLKQGAVTATFPKNQTVTFNQNSFTGETVVIRVDDETGKVIGVSVIKNKQENDNE